MGIIACVEVTTTTTGTTLPVTTTTSITSTSPSITTPIPSGTTIVPTSAQTTTICQKAMAQVGGVYVSSVTYSVRPVMGTNNADLTDTTSNGVSFPSQPSSPGLFTDDNKPIYTILLTFPSQGVSSFSVIKVNPNSNVKVFTVEFFDASNPTQPVTSSPQFPNQPLSLTSTIVDSQASLVDFPSNLPSSVVAIRISIIGTTDNA